MRVGEARPVKRSHISFARVTACILVSIPHQSDYYADRFAVLKLCLGSLLANTPRDLFNLNVFDNASCAPVIDYLRELQLAGHIDQLTLSHQNVGKIHACRMMFDAAAGEVVAYADDDVWFGPGWLEAQLRILDTFPGVGMVSARPVRKQFAYGNKYLDGYLAKHSNVTVTRGRLIPDEWEQEFLHSTGRENQPLSTHDDVRLECNGVKAYSTANHFQFIAPRTVILAALKKRDQPRTGSEERQFEEAVDDMGYARLSTADRFVRHIGNVISDEISAEAKRTTPLIAQPTYRRSSAALVRLAALRPVRAVVARLNRWTYFLLNQR